MRCALLVLPLVVLAALTAPHALASDRSFVYTQESRVLAPGDSELDPWTTFRVGRSRYYSALDGRLELQHGLLPGLQLGLYWNFSTEAQDVEQDPLTRELSRVSRSEFSSASVELKYMLSDAAADLLGSALYLDATLGPRKNVLEGRLVLDRSWGKWLAAGNVVAELELDPTRNDNGSQLQTAFIVQPLLAAAYALPYGTSVGVELRAPLALTGDAKSTTLFGGPVVRWSDRGFWAAFGVEPQLAAFSGKSSNSRLDLGDHERLELRLLAGFKL